MIRDTPIFTRTKLRARKLIHTRITDLNDLREVYAIGDVIGKGNFGTVVKAKHRDTKVYWAIKVINKRQAGASRVLLVEREIYILKLVKHPNIILLDRVFESPKTIYLVFELCIESLATMFKVKKQFPESETIDVIKSLSSALAYLHKNDIVHRDLKLENILTAYNPDDSDDKLFIKVTDFGLSTMRTGPGHDNMLHDFCGTLAYMAPEMITTKSYSQQCDIWSTGIIMYLLLVGKFPFYTGNQQQLGRLISKAKIDFSGLSCSSEARHLLSKLLEKNPAFRITAAEVKNHPWISGKQNTVQTESSNVLDMMRLWREDMLETSLDAVTTNRRSVSKQTEEISDTQDTKHEGRDTKRKLSTVDNAVSIGQRKALSSPMIDSVQERISDSKNQLPRQSVTSKLCERTLSRLPDFSHIPAKVDSNLGYSRKDSQRKRESTRKLTR